MKGIIILGVVIALAGLITFAYPMFTTSRSEDVAKLGDFKVQTQEQVHHSIPPIISGGLLVLGAVLIGAGAFGRR
ncbi:MAG TPA: hypothetical protein VJN94_04405 [Candidatus Binataceae bacterium]|nr:hypothetical protein [Candidatus Binataceae bacterium]